MTVSHAPNRLLLTLVGGLLSMAGVVVLLLATGMTSKLPAVPTWAAELPTAQDTLGDSSAMAPWVPWAVLVAAALLTCAAVWWVIGALPRTDSTREFQIHSDGRLGVTRLDAGALQQAVAESAEALPGVVGARVRMEGTADHPGVTIKVDIDERSDIQATAQRIHHHILSGIETSLSSPLEQVRLIIEPVRRRQKSSQATVDVSSAARTADGGEFFRM